MTVTQCDLSRLTRQLVLMSTISVIAVELKSDRVISIDFTNVTSRVAIIAWKCASHRCRAKRKKKQTEIHETKRKMYFQCVYKYSHARESSFMAPTATWLPHGNKTNISIPFDCVESAQLYYKSFKITWPNFYDIYYNLYYR